MNVTFDRLRLELPIECVRILCPDAFSKTISRDGELSNMKYEQKSPFYYQILVKPGNCKAYVEFSGKALLENYPSLISATNFNECIHNINKFEIVEMNPADVMSYAKVGQCDVTVDLYYGDSFSSLYNSLTISNSRNYVIAMRTGNRFTIQNTVATNRKRERMIIYDKAEEMARPDNRLFLNFVKNPDEQRLYFCDKIRLELNLNSYDRIRKYFCIKDLSLYRILYAPTDPIGNFLRMAFQSEDPVDVLKRHTPKLRSLEHLLLICLCDFDQTKIEKVIRDTTGTKNSITTTMKPFKELLAAINHKDASPTSDENVLIIRSALRNAIQTYLDQDNQPEDTGLLSLYRTAREKSNDIAVVDILDLEYVNLNYLPDDE